MVAKLGKKGKLKESLYDQVRFLATAGKNSEVYKVLASNEMFNRLVERYSELVREELNQRFRSNPTFPLAKKMMEYSKGKKLTRSQIWAQWFLPLKMWAKGHPINFARKVEREILRKQGALTYDEAFRKALQESRKIDYLPWIAGAIATTINNDFDFMTAVIGYEGTGKSSFALALARDLTAFGFGFDIYENIFFGSTPVEQVIKRIESTKRQVFIFDEADAFFDSRNSMKKWQKDLIRAIVMGRARNHVYILATPDVHGIDVRFRERRVTHIFHMIDRNLVALLMKHTTSKDRDGFKYEYLMWKLRSLPPASRLIARAFMELDTCYGVFQLNGMPISKEMYNIYKQLKMELNRIYAGQELGQAGNLIIATVLYSILKTKEGQQLLNEVSNKTNYPTVIFRRAVQRVLKGYDIEESVIANFLKGRHGFDVIDKAFGGNQLEEKTREKYPASLTNPLLPAVAGAEEEDDVDEEAFDEEAEVTAEDEIVDDEAVDVNEEEKAEDEEDYEDPNEDEDVPNLSLR